jgi:HEPN domain-containing protein
MIQKTRKDVVWWLSSAKDDYKSAMKLYEVGMHANALNLLHTSIEKVLKAAILWTLTQNKQKNSNNIPH